jgi:arabinogalactan oligomer / maltooligosaccharide transport system substrate-binding protein
MTSAERTPNPTTYMLFGQARRLVYRRPVHPPAPAVWPVTAALALALAGCAGEGDRPRGQPVRFWHTFSAQETAALGGVLRDRPVETTLVPFARGQTLLDEALRRGDCPDLIRIDATWLPGLVEADLLRPIDDGWAAARDLLPEAAALGQHRGARYGVPQSLDGLALIHRAGGDVAAALAAPPVSLAELVALGHRLAIGKRFGLDVRVDGYWWLAFLRAAGGDVLDPAGGTLGIDRPAAAASLAGFAALVAPGGVAPPPAPPGEESRDEVRRFTAGEVAIAINGPWAVWELSGGRPDALDVAPFPRGPDGAPAAPLGAQLLAVPRCAARPDADLELAAAILDPAVQADWGRRFGVVPTTAAGLAGAGRVAQRFHAALGAARPLPRHPVAAELFDDLTPAVEAVVAGDATADEALAGVGRAWTRLAARHGVLIGGAREAAP